MHILEVCDRPGWAIDRLSKPLSEMYDNVDMSYFSVSANRYLASGYSNKEGNAKYTIELANQYDIVHYHRAEASYKDLDKVKGRKILSIHTERTKDLDDKQLEQFDDIICPTKFVYNYLKNKNLKSNLHQVSYGIETDRFANVQYNVDSIYTGFVGRIVPWKRWDLIQKISNEVGMKTLGCGYIERGELFNVYNYKEGTDFEFNNFITENLMSMFYERMGIFLCLSESHIETGPLPVMEAMAAGIPVITTRVGWAVDHCEHLENVVFIDENEIDYAKNILSQVKNDKELRLKLSENGRKLAMKFDISKYAQNLMEIYNKEKI